MPMQCNSLPGSAVCSSHGGFSSRSLTESRSRSILALHRTFRSIYHRTATFKNFFDIGAIHPISLTAKSMVLVQLFASNRFLPPLPCRTMAFCTYWDTGPPCFTQQAMDESLICSNSATARCNGKPLFVMYISLFWSAHVNRSACHLASQSLSLLSGDTIGAHPRICVLARMGYT